MKKILFIALCAVAVALTAVSCSKDNGTDVTLESSWKALVKKYPAFSVYPDPELPVEIKVPVHNERAATIDFPAIESLSFIVKVEEKVALDYYGKLEKAGFKSTTDAVKGMYSKVDGKKTYGFIGSYTMGSFGLMFNIETEK